MPEAANLEDPNVKENVKTKDEKKLKKSATSNGLSSFTRGKLVLARVNMLDGTVTDLSIEVRSAFIFNNPFLTQENLSFYNLSGMDN